MTTRRSPSIGLVTAMLLVVPITLLGACGGGGQGGSGASGDSATDGSEPDTEADATTADSATAAGRLTTETLLGEWTKVDDGDPACADYPDQLTFESFGYLSSIHDDRSPVLDGGSWEIDGDQLLLSNPLDAIVSFPATLTDGDVLELDTGTCTLRYRRS